MIISKYVDVDISFVIFVDRRSGFGMGRIVEINEIMEDEVFFEFVMFKISFVFFDFVDVSVRGKGEDMKIKSGYVFYVGEDIVFDGVS